mgnify:CR=1 FL=1
MSWIYHRRLCAKRAACLSPHTIVRLKGLLVLDILCPTAMEQTHIFSMKHRNKIAVYFFMFNHSVIRKKFHDQNER